MAIISQNLLNYSINLYKNMILVLKITPKRPILPKIAVAGRRPVWIEIWIIVFKITCLRVAGRRPVWIEISGICSNASTNTVAGRRPVWIEITVF